VDRCGSQNDTPPTYVAENIYWTTTTPNDHTVVFHAKDGYAFDTSDGHVTDEGKTYTVTFIPNSDAFCSASAEVDFTQPDCDQGGTATPGDTTGAHWAQDYGTATGSYVFTAVADSGYKFFESENSEGTDEKTFQGDLPGPTGECSEATASIDTSPATCTQGATAAPGDINNATWAEGDDTVTGPNDYSFTATAFGSHTFAPDSDDSDGTWVTNEGTVKHFSGTLAGPDASLCTPKKPNPVPVSESVEGCDLIAYGLLPGTGHRNGTRDWALVDGQWVLQAPAWGPYVQDHALTDDEYQAQCAGPKPEPQTRTVHQEESGCDVGGVHSWDEVYTTPFVWDHVTKTWVLGEETGPVVENDTLTPYTAQELEDLGCVEVEGEQGHKPPKHHPNTPSTPEVKGEQATVPTEVEAGLAGTPADRVPAGGGSNLPLWLLSVGGGLFLTGAGRLRRRGEAGRSSLWRGGHPSG
jgi:hypothetical protein